MTITYRKKIWLMMLVVALVGCVLFFPFPTQVVPEWKVRIVDEAGMPYGGQRVSESWANYSLQLGAESGDERWTDNAGWVVFPRRTLSMGLVSRVFHRVLTYLGRYLHGSTGIRAYLQTSGPQGTQMLDYEPGKPPPQIWMLPRNAPKP